MGHAGPVGAATQLCVAGAHALGGTPFIQFTRPDAVASVPGTWATKEVALAITSGRDAVEISVHAQGAKHVMIWKGLSHVQRVRVLQALGYAGASMQP